MTARTLSRREGDVIRHFDRYGRVVQELRMGGPVPRWTHRYYG